MMIAFPRKKPPHQAHYIRQLLPKEKPFIVGAFYATWLFYPTIATRCA